MLLKEGFIRKDQRVSAQKIYRNVVIDNIFRSGCNLMPYEVAPSNYLFQLFISNFKVEKMKTVDHS